jgi:aryl-alcohol dehydrogenase-like predicted oxidoreductase
MIDATPTKKKIILGTALWGWGITRAEAFSLLENYFINGGVIVDTATNYPINKCKKDFGLAIRWLVDWTYLHPNEKFSLIVKVGSKNNMGGPEVDLSPNTIIETTKRLRDD